MEYTLVFFILLLFFLIRSRRKTAVRLRLIRKRKQKKERTVMNELLKQYVGKNCIIYSLEDFVNTTGVITSLNEPWMEVETKNGKKLVNTEYVLRIEEKPEKKK